MNKKVAAIVLGAAVVVLGAVAAFSGKGTTSAKVDDKAVITVTDGRGQVEVTKNPQKVVTFDYGVLDALDNMGIEVAGLAKGSIPAYLDKYNDEKYANLGTLKEPDFEAVNALKPDLIIISGRQQDMYDKFAEIAPTIYLNVDGTNYMETFKRNMDTLGTIFDKEELLDEKIANIEKQIAEVKNTVTENDLNASTIMVNEGALSAFGAESRFGLIYNEIGFKNLDTTMEESTHGQQVSFEYLVEKNPEYLFVVDRGAATGNEGTAKSVLDNDLVKSTDAYKNDKIVYLNSAAWYTVAGGINSTETMVNDIVNAIK